MLKYWIWLATRRGMSPRSICLVARHFSTAERAYYAAPGEYENIEGLKDPSPLLDKDLTGAEEILSRCRRQNISVLTMQDAAYPRRLAVIDDAPAVLYCRGSLPDLSGPAVSVVGTRQASAYGMTQARRFGYGLAASGCTVVSGGAKGVDTEAVKGALTGAGQVVLVLGCGVDVVYPASNRHLFRDVQQHGCLLSEYPPGTQALAHHFPVRNRIISALSMGVLVVEAPEKSGALITAHQALEQGRDVFVLPANVDVASCGGNLRLLREGAIPAMEVWDILEEYDALYPGQLVRRPLPEREPPRSEPPAAPEMPPQEKKVIDKPKNKAYIDLKDRMDDLSQDEQRLAQLLQDGPAHIDTLVEGSQLSAGQALSLLTVLEVKGIVRRPAARMYELAEQ